LTPTRHDLLVFSLALLASLTLSPAFAADTQPASSPKTLPEAPATTLFPEEMAQLKDAIAKQNADKALELASALITKHPGQPEAYLVRAELYAQLKEFDSAKADIQKAIAISPAHTQGNIMLAAITLREGDAPAALKIIDTALTKKPNDPKFLAARTQIQAQIKPSEQDEAKAAQAARAKSVELALAYQKNPQDPAALAALLAHVRTVAAAINNTSDASLMPLAASEYNEKSPDSAPSDIQKNRAKAEALADSLAIPRNIELADPAKARTLFDQPLAIYPLPRLLLRRAFVNYQQGDLKAASQDALLACAIDALHTVQRPSRPLPAAHQSSPNVQGRRLFTQFDRLQNNSPSTAEKEIQVFIDSVAAQDWSVAQKTYRLNRAQWNSPLSPLGVYVARRDYPSKVVPEIQKVYTLRLNELIAGTDDKALTDLADEVYNLGPTDPDTIDALINAWTKLKETLALNNTIDAVLKSDPYNPSARIAQGKALEAQNKPIDALLMYNTGARGKDIASLSSYAKTAAEHRDRIEAKLTRPVTFQAYSDYLSKELDSARPGSRKLPILEAALTRYIPVAEHKNDLLFYRGEIYFKLREYQKCINDMQALIGKQEDLQPALWCFIGDASFNLAQEQPASDKRAQEILFKQAIDAYTHAIPLVDPKKTSDLGTLHYSRANCLDAINDSAKAAPDYLKAISLLPDTAQTKAWAHFNLSKDQHASGDKEGAYQNAVKALNLARESFPQMPVPISAWVVVLNTERAR
jgi:tetratricopeptide (TPR) repeat protein